MLRLYVSLKSRKNARWKDLDLNPTCAFGRHAVIRCATDLNSVENFITCVARFFCVQKSTLCLR